MPAGPLLAETIQAWRSLLHRPRYLIVASLTLALGIAATVAVFALMRQTLLRPLPFPAPDRLAVAGMSLDGSELIASPLMYQRLKAMSPVVSAGIANTYVRNVNVDGRDLPAVGRVLVADRGFLDTLGVVPALGRNFAQTEDQPGGARVAVIAHGFWAKQLGGDPGVVGRILRIEGESLTVVGVLPETFSWPTAFDLITPMQLAADTRDMDTNQFVVLRLAPGTSIEAAGAEAGQRMRTLFDELRPQFGPEALAAIARLRFDAEPISELYTGGLRTTLLLFLAASLCVLSIAAVNLANLALLRALLRSHDTAVRAALGAPLLRLVFPALVEALPIGALGSAFGLLLAWAALHVFGGLAPEEWALGDGASPGLDAFAFALVGSVLVALASAAFGAWRGQRSAWLPELIGGGRTGLSRGVGWLGRVLVVTQVALAMLLLVVAGLFMRNLQRLSSVPMGFDAGTMLTFSLMPVRDANPDIDAVNRQTLDILDRLRALPGVERVSVSSNLPAGSQLNYPATLDDGRAVQPQFRPVDPTYFATFRIPLLAGRGFGAHDTPGAEPVCIVDRTFAERHFGGNALGRTVRLGAPDNDALPKMRVVGVVGAVRHGGPTEAAEPTVYVPMMQLPASLWPAVREFASLRYAVRTRGDIADGEAMLRRAVAEAAPGQAIAEVKPMRRIVSSLTARSRLQLLLVGTFAVVALGLACIGLYAVLSVGVAARSHEYGVRSALGATPQHLLARVLGDCLLQIAIGLAIGLGVALALSGSIRRFLDGGIDPADPVAIAMSAIALLATGLIASILPAWRVASIDPMRALRVE